jgi:hypothetical protein
MVQPCANIAMSSGPPVLEPAVRMPSPMNSQRIDSAPITGVMMKGSSETKITGPGRRLGGIVDRQRDGQAQPITSGRVISVKVSVKRSAFQKSMAAVRPAPAAWRSPPRPFGFQHVAIALQTDPFGGRSRILPFSSRTGGLRVSVVQVWVQEAGRAGLDLDLLDHRLGDLEALREHADQRAPR